MIEMKPHIHNAKVGQALQQLLDESTDLSPTSKLLLETIAHWHTKRVSLKTAKKFQDAMAEHYSIAPQDALRAFKLVKGTKLTSVKKGKVNKDEKEGKETNETEKKGKKKRKNQKRKRKEEDQKTVKLEVKEEKMDTI